MRDFFSRIFQFYVQGFRSMTLGKTLWKIIIIKIFIIFAVIRVFFCPDYLQTRYSTDQERAEHVLSVVTAPASDINRSSGGLVR